MSVDPLLSIKEESISLSSQLIQPDIHEEEEDVAETSNLLQQVKEKRKRPDTSLSTLYATEVILPNANKQYPELPNITRSVPRVQNMIRSPSSYNPAHESTTMQPIPSAPLLVERNDVVNTSVAHGTESTLVNELLQENTRLQDEVSRLKSMLAAPAQQQNTVAQTQANSIAGISISDPTQPPREGVKYVCCGSCRQWLLAPKDAMLVACSRCEAINNCALLNETRIPQQHLANQSYNNNPFPVQLPWFLDCFNRSLYT